jgi:tetratricopeptide (TPR) repeat protein
MTSAITNANTAKPKPVAMIDVDTPTAATSKKTAPEDVYLALKKKPDLPLVSYKMGLIALTRGNFEAAARHMLKELETNPGHSNAWHYLGDAYIRIGKIDEAAEALQRAIWLNLQSTKSYILLANVYSQQERYFVAENTKIEDDHRLEHVVDLRLFERKIHRHVTCHSSAALEVSNAVAIEDDAMKGKRLARRSPDRSLICDHRWARGRLTRGARLRLTCR